MQYNGRVQNNARIRNRMWGYNTMEGYKIKSQDTRRNARIKIECEDKSGM
jgi:hypothetical protein